MCGWIGIGDILIACAAAAPTTVLTNGMLLAGRRLEILRALPRDRTTLQISLDSPTPERHDAILSLRYALIVSVTAKRMRDLYDRVVRRYRTQLEALRPVIEIPIRVDTGDTESYP